MRASDGDGDPADETALRRLRRICFALPGVTETTLQGRPLFRVGRRRFALFNGTASPARPRWASCGRSLHFLADPAEREALRHDRRFAPSPHHGDRGWLSLSLERDEPDWDEIAELLDAAYRQVAPPAR